MPPQSLAGVVRGVGQIDEEFHVFANELLCGGWLPIFTVGSRVCGDRYGG